MGVQTVEMSKLGWLIGWSSRDMWTDSLYFLYVVLDSICKTFSSFQHTLWPPSCACWANFNALTWRYSLALIGFWNELRNLTLLILLTVAVYILRIKWAQIGKLMFVHLCVTSPEVHTSFNLILEIHSCSLISTSLWVKLKLKFIIFQVRLGSRESDTYET
jgi:hypothetical protein